MTQVSLFVSAATAEFQACRVELHDLLTRHNAAIKIQEHLVASGTLTLDKLDVYVRACEGVVHLVGSEPGAPANEPSLAWVRQTYPDLPRRFPALDPVLAGTVAATYTQWEAYLAVYHGRVLLVARPEALTTPTTAAHPGAPQSSAEHLARLRQLGHYPEITFGNTGWLAAEVALSTLFDLAVQAGVRAAGLATALRPGPQNLPYPSLKTLFKGRAPLVQELRERLVLGGGLPCQMLRGLGGIGKTRLAVEYAWQHRYHYQALLFVRADSPAALETNLAALAAPRILHLPGQMATEQDSRLTAVLNWLTEHPGWLLILDNVDTPEAAQAVRQYLPRFADGHVLLTSRLDKLGKHVGHLAPDVLPADDARDFLLARAAHRTRTATDEAEAAALAQDLGHLALALELAGAYLDETHATLPAYRQRWAADDATLRDWLEPDQTEDYAATVASTWLTTFKRLTPAAQTLLGRLAWLAAAPVPTSLLDVPVPGTEPLDTDQARRDLERYSLLTYADADNYAAFRVHRLVRRVTRHRLSPEARRQAFQEALSWVDAAFAGDPQDVRNWPVLEPLRPHALALGMTHAPTFDDPEPTNRLLNQLGVLFDAKSLFKEAEPIMRRALTISEARYGSDHLDITADLNNLALLLQATNRLAEAEPLMNRALLIMEHSLGPDHPTVALGLNTLAQLLQATNRLAEAEPLLRRALAITEASYGPDHPTVATRLSNLASLLRATNRLVEAEPLMRRALRIIRDSFTPDHPTVALYLNNLAQLMQAANHLDEAEPLMRQALAITEASYGPDHPTVANRLNNLGTLLRTTNRLAEAEPLLRRALAITEACFGPDHPTVATRLNNLGLLLRATNHLAEAEPLLRRAVTLFSTFYQQTGHPHPHYQATVRSYAQLLAALNQSPEIIQVTLCDLGIQLDDPADAPPPA